MQANDPPRRLGFGVFGVDLRDRQLTKRGLRIRLQEQPFQVLAMLLERPGEVVTRDELRNRLWPNTVVEFDHGLNKAISKIREVLGDSVESPRFVETSADQLRRDLDSIIQSQLPTMRSPTHDLGPQCARSLRRFSPTGTPGYLDQIFYSRSQCRYSDLIGAFPTASVAVFPCGHRSLWRAFRHGDAALVGK
jgi:Transcriptional regulatory protein, C terminal